MQEQGVVAHDQMRVQRRLAADRGYVAQRLAGDGHAIADAAAQHDHVVGATDRHLASNERDHAGAPASWVALASASASGAPLRWQRATASASEA